MFVKKYGQNPKHRARIWATNTRKGHRKAGFVVNITIQEIIDKFRLDDDPRCAICDCKINIKTDGIGTRYEDGPSLDRINNERELNINNVQLLCRRCNSMKYTLPMLDYVKFCGMVYNKFKTEMGLEEGCG